MTALEPIKLILFIVNRGEGKRVEKICSEDGIYGHLLLHGRGTADSETLSMLGLGEKEKDVILVTAAESRKKDIIDKITKKLKLDEPGRGIALSIPFSSIASQMNSYYALTGLQQPNGAETEAE